MTLAAQITEMAQAARAAAPVVAGLSTEQKNQLLEQMAVALLEQKDAIKAFNEKDVTVAQTEGRLNKAAIDRLILNDQRIEDMANGLREVAALPDPVGGVLKDYERPNGLKIQKVRIPLGVIGMIYESRPNVTVDAAGLCLKSGNVIILRGGKEAIHSNQGLGDILRAVCQQNGVNPDIIQVIPFTDREAMNVMVRQTKYIDLMIPRGGEALMQWMNEHSQVPVVKHDKGLCHAYVHADADINMAAEIIFNGKVQRPGVCNALETILVDEAIAAQALSVIAEKLRTAGVELRGCAKTQAILPDVTPATDEDWDTEYLDLILAVKIVADPEAAAEHIRQHGSLHTEIIITSNEAVAQTFLKNTEASCVMWNASSRFNDGGQLGLGAEIGISTTKLHAFGPMGLEELTTSKFVVTGTGQVRS